MSSTSTVSAAPTNYSFDGIALPDIVQVFSRRRQQQNRIQLLAALGDMAAVLAGFSLGATIRYMQPLNEQAISLVVLFVPLYAVLATSYHAYSMTTIARSRLSVSRATGALLLTISLIGLAAFLLKTTDDISRGIIAIGTPASLLLLAGFRTYLAGHTRHQLGATLVNDVVIEDGVKAPSRPGSIVLNAERDGLALQLKSPEMLDRLGHCLRSADKVVVACRQEQRASWVSALKSCNINAEILTPELNSYHAIGLGYYEGSTTLAVATAPLTLSDQVLKRCLDLLIATIALPFFALVMIIVSVITKLTSKGPVFFCQPRVGLGNRVFQIYKFRTMRAEQTDISGGRSASRDDDRVTPFGRFMRKTSIDELPQILNVLKGDMSIVGPRPHPLECRAANRLFIEIDQRYSHRHAVKPGITGLAQVRGFRGATEHESDLIDRLQADLEYMSGWTIWRDLGVILATFKVLIHPNAY